MPKIAFIGAGSTVFARNLIGDVLRFPALAISTTFALMDIDPERLRTTELAARALARAHGAGPAIEATVDRRAALGLCHAVHHTAADRARALGISGHEVDYHLAGINHVAFLLRLEREGEDLYPALRGVLEEGRVPDDNRVRYELFMHFGHFAT